MALKEEDQRYLDCLGAPAIQLNYQFAELLSNPLYDQVHQFPGHQNDLLNFLTLQDLLDPLVG